MCLDYNIEEKQLLSVFRQYRNDINIYTEDCAKDKSFYELLFKRLLDGTNVHISDIYPLGDCDSVVKASMQSKDSRGIYVIDGDIYVIYAPKIPRENLFVLDSYCIENFVIDERSVVDTMFNLSGRIYKKERLKEMLDFTHAFDTIIQPIMDLFFLMSIERKYCHAFELKEYDRYTKKGGLFDIGKVQNEIDTIKKRLVPHVISRNVLVDEIEMFKKMYPYNIANFLKIVSGKDYIIPFVKRYVCHKMNFKYQIPKEAWKFQFANYCDLKRLAPLKVVITKLANA